MAETIRDMACIVTASAGDGIVEVMHTYTPRTFTIAPLEDISARSVEEHIALYHAYVKNLNALSALLVEYAQDTEKNAHILAELTRRRSFEFDGMRLHELYFEQFEGGASLLSPDSMFAHAAAEQYGSVEALIADMRRTAMMRGPGWAMLYYDASSKTLLSGFVGEQHQGHFATLPIVFALDVWEHAFLLDQGALGKAAYVEAFFKNLNWGVVDKRFETLAR